MYSSVHYIAEIMPLKPIAGQRATKGHVMIWARKGTSKVHFDICLEQKLQAPFMILFFVYYGEILTL